MNATMAYKLDLNLLRILCMLVETNNVTETARRLEMGVSSVSYALNKLRAHYSDPIMIRVRNGMQPTLLAVGLHKHFSPALHIIEPVSVFTDTTGKPSQYIRIRTSSIFEGWIAWELSRSETFSSAGNVFEFNEGSANEDTRVDQLRLRQVHLDIGSALPADRAIAQHPFTLKGFKVACRRQHPRLNGPATLDSLLKESMITWVRKSESINAYKDLLNFEGAHLLEKPLRFTSLLTMLTLVARSDFFSIIPTCLENFVEEMFDIKVLETEFLENLTYPMFVHTLYASREDPVIQSVLALALSLDGL
ncbi:LysR family transcriptional regulator [Enterobacteriaceae bacterium Kacie_13]|nr:LysR family transcriptional regulator [Enterobacteriaceae bacterium Kacie_13]